MAANGDRILIIDDDPNLLELLSAQLEASGFTPFTSLGNEEIPPLLDRTMPDLLILDLMLPKVSGFEILPIIRNHPVWKDLQVIILSAVGDESSMVKGLKLGAQDYIPKPFRRQELIARIERNLEVKRYQETLKMRSKQLETLLGNLDRIINRVTSGLLSETEEARLILHELTSAVRPCDVTGFVLTSPGLTEGRLTLSRPMESDERADLEARILEELRRVVSGAPAEDNSRPIFFYEGPGVAGPPLRNNDLQSAATIPLRAHDRAAGMLFLASTAGSAFSEGDIYFMYALTAQTQSIFAKEREKEKLRDEFLHLIAHDLKSPITSVMAYCQLLEKGDRFTAEERQSFIRMIIDVTRFQLFLIDNITIIPRVESEAVPIESVIFPAAHILRQVEETFHNALEFHGTVVEITADPRLRVQGDVALVERCINNIACTIIESTRKDTIALKAVREGDRVVFTIASAEMVIDDESRAELFIKHKVGKSPLTRGERGLGLYLARRILDRHNAEIEVQSSETGGTKFTFALPSANSE